MPLVQADAALPPVRPSSVNGVIRSEAIEHIEPDDAVITEIARVLRPSGLLVLTAPNLWNASRLIEMIKRRDFTVNIVPHHLREYAPRHLRSLLPIFVVAGWSPVTFGWTGKVGGPIDWLIRVGISKRFPKPIRLRSKTKIGHPHLTLNLDTRGQIKTAPALPLDIKPM